MGLVYGKLFGFLQSWTSQSWEPQSNLIHDKPTELDQKTPLNDPHIAPTFDAPSLEQRSRPLLYLPPLLSSLPSSIPPITGNNVKTLVTETRLPNIDPVSLSLHKALHHFGPLTEDYASTPYAEAFNWNELELPEDEEREWYCVAFRSKRNQDSNSKCLCSLLLNILYSTPFSTLRCRQVGSQRGYSEWRSKFVTVHPTL